MRSVLLGTTRSQLAIATLLGLWTTACAPSNHVGTGKTDGGAPACTTNGDCLGGNVCVANHCVAPVMPMCGSSAMSCQADSQCPSQQCDQTGCCLAVCTADSDCMAEQDCVSGVCRDIGLACMTSADCPHSSAPVCDTTTGACVRCTDSTMCPPGVLCQNNACATSTVACSATVKCTIAQLPECDTSVPGGRCVECLTTADCPTMDTCVNFACQQPMTGCNWNGDCTTNPMGAYCSASGKCVACLVNSDCPAGSACQTNNTCVASSTCVADASCPADKPHCSPVDHFCAECVLNTDCPNNEICKSGHCEAAVNGCIANSDCIAPLVSCDMSTRQCVGCMSDADCGAFCVNMECTPCTTDESCAEAFLLQDRVLCNDAKACVQCIGNPDCSGGDVCSSTGTCIPNPLNGPCPTGGVCPTGLLCVPDGTATGTCRQTCSLYSDNCGGGLICGTTSAVTPPSGACQPSIAGSSSLGQSCSASQPCDRNGLCLPSSASGSSCFGLCDPLQSTAACSGSNSCENVVVLTSANVPVAIGACLPDNDFDHPCSTPSQCGSGEVCAAEGNPTHPLTVANLCWWPVGAGGPGAGCSHDADCASGICIPGMPQNEGYPGFCQGGCDSNSSCPVLRTDMYPGACESFPTSWYSATGTPTTVDVLTCATQCRDDSECPTTQTCDATPDWNGSAWVTRCVPSQPAGSFLGGAVCLADSDCLSGNCLTIESGKGGICAGVCNPAGAGAADCAPGATCPSGGVVVRLPGPDGIYFTADDVLNQPAPICWTRSCTANSQCGPSGTCTIPPTTGTTVDVSCYPTQGTTPGGATCSVSSDCQSGYCITWSTGPACFGVCNPANGNADCASPSTCVTAEFPSTTQVFSYCYPG